MVVLLSGLNGRQHIKSHLLVCPEHMTTQGAVNLKPQDTVDTGRTNIICYRSEFDREIVIHTHMLFSNCALPGVVT